MMNQLEPYKQKRNRQENELIIAGGVLALMKKGQPLEKIRAADISRELHKDPDVVQDHFSDGMFIERNCKTVAESFYNRLKDPVNPKIFAAIFLTCVLQNRALFSIEFQRASRRIFEEVMTRLKPTIVFNWPKQSDGLKTTCYRVLCEEVFYLLQQWHEAEFVESQQKLVERKIVDLLTIFSGRPANKIYIAELQ